MSSCTHLQEEVQKDITMSLPEKYSREKSDNKTIKNWWRTFPFKGLNAFIVPALKENLSIKEAKARLEQIKAVAKKTGATLYPSLNLTARAGRTEIENNNTGTISADEYSLGLAASYEIDFWQKLSSSKKAANLDVEASKKDLETVYMTLTALIVENWVNAATELNIQNKLNEQIKLNEDLLKNLEIKYTHGNATSVDYLRQEQVLASTKAALPLSLKRYQIKLNELNLLAGKASGTKIEISKNTMDPFPPFPETGFPIDLINNRPDVQKSYLSFQAEIARLYAGKANRMPSLKLDASYIFSADNISNLFDNWIISLLGSILTPLIDGNLRKAEVERLEASVTQKIASYKNTVLSALKDVENSIINETNQIKHLKEIEKQIIFSSAVFKNSLLRYQNGMIDFITVANFLQALQNLEIQYIQKIRDLWIYRISLHRSLGGNWINDLKNMSTNKE